MSHNIYTIYKATNNVNGKVYIGFDSKWPKRMKTHKGNFKTIDYAFYRAIRKYGWEAFSWEIIYQSKDKDYTLKEMEPYFIKENNSFGVKGYNMTFGGEGQQKPMSKETKLKLKIANTGRIPWNKGVKTPEETKNKQSLAKKGKAKSNSGSFKKGQIPWCKGIKINIKHDKQFKKNQVPWNKGLVMSEEQKDLLSKVKKGKAKSNSGSFKKGQIPWNKKLI